jgi:hypothetical protein
MMKKTARILLPLAAAAALFGLAGGVADAAPATPAAVSADPGTAIWALPGLDVGSLLGPTIAAPAQLLAPLDGLLNLFS